MPGRGDGIVMHDQAISRRTNIKLNPCGARFGGSDRGGNGVFGLDCGGSTVATDKRSSLARSRAPWRVGHRRTVLPRPAASPVSGELARRTAGPLTKKTLDIVPTVP